MKDHIFGSECFIPATVIMELFAETAVWFVEWAFNERNLLVSNLKNLFIKRALAVQPGKIIDTRIEILFVKNVDGQYELEIQITSPRISATNSKILGRRLNATCTVIVSSQYTIGRDSFVPEGLDNHIKFESESYYKYYYPSHGHLFQSLTGKFSFDSSCRFLIGEYDCQNKQQSFVLGVKNSFHLSPLGYDSCLQYAVYLSRISHLFGRLPIGGEEICIHSRHPESGKCTVIVERTYIDDQIMECNFYSYTNDGKPIVSARSFQVKRAFFHKYERDEFDQPLQRNRVERNTWFLSSEG
ncbi:MAG: hypothetical protein GX267_11710 [Fibrobacter sp.]|nr:hypothetical protein [Fibrobacter sp.]